MGRGAQHTVIKPIPETIEPIFDKVFCCSKVEPGIDYEGRGVNIGQLGVVMGSLYKINQATREAYIRE